MLSILTKFFLYCRLQSLGPQKGQSPKQKSKGSSCVQGGRRTGFAATSREENADRPGLAKCVAWAKDFSSRVCTFACAPGLSSVQKQSSSRQIWKRRIDENSQLSTSDAIGCAAALSSYKTYGFNFNLQSIYLLKLSIIFYWTPEFCTSWPEALKSNEDCEERLPVKTTTTDYLHSSPSIRDPLSRIVTLQVENFCLISTNQLSVSNCRWKCLASPWKAEQGTSFCGLLRRGTALTMTP